MWLSVPIPLDVQCSTNYSRHLLTPAWNGYRSTQGWVMEGLMGKWTPSLLSELTCVVSQSWHLLYAFPPPGTWTNPCHVSLHFLFSLLSLARKRSAPLASVLWSSLSHTSGRGWRSKEALFSSSSELLQGQVCVRPKTTAHLIRRDHLQDDNQIWQFLQGSSSGVETYWELLFHNRGVISLKFLQ